MTAVLDRPSARRVTRPTYWRTMRGRHRTTTLAGDAVHHDGCPVIARELGAIPWRQMDDQPGAAVRAIAAIDPLLTLCAVCWTGAPMNQAGATVTTELARTNDLQGMSLGDQLALAEKLAEASLLPKAYQRQPANVLLAQQYATMQQIPTMTAITNVDVIEGKLRPSAALVEALVRRAGHHLRVYPVEGAGKVLSVTVEIRRKDDPTHTYRVTWSLDDAQQAGLVSKDVWKKYPRRMLKHRAVTECADAACPEVLMGLDITPDQAAEVDTWDVDERIVDVTPELERGRIPEGNRDRAALHKSIWQHAQRLWPDLGDDATLMAELEGEFYAQQEAAWRDATTAQLQAFDTDLAGRVA